MILDKYFNFINIFSEKKALVLLEQTKLNKHNIKLENDKQLSYRPIYSLGLIKLKTLKIYIKTFLKTRYIQPLKSFAGTLILFYRKPDSSHWLCINY